MISHSRAEYVRGRPRFSPQDEVGLLQTWHNKVYEVRKGLLKLERLQIGHHGPVKVFSSTDRWAGLVCTIYLEALALLLVQDLPY